VESSGVGREATTVEEHALAGAIGNDHTRRPRDRFTLAVGVSD